MRSYVDGSRTVAFHKAETANKITKLICTTSFHTASSCRISRLDTTDCMVHAIRDY